MAFDASTLASRSHMIRAPGARIWRNLLILAVLLGAACRIAQYAADRSYWHDEACIVLNVRDRSAGQLLQALDYDQAAPPLFLLAERAMYVRYGASEWSLRLMPTLAGVAGVLIFGLLAWRLMPGGMAVAATTLFACSDQLIARAVEVKPYGTDAAIAALLTWLAVGMTPRLSATARLAMVALVGAAAVWFSYPAILLAAAVCLALLPGLRREKPRSWLVVASLLALVVVGSFAVLYCVVIRAQQTAALDVSWSDCFADLHRPWMWVVWAPRRLLALCNFPCESMGPIVMIAAGIGAAALWRERRRELLFMLAGPILLTIAAAFAQRYPLDGSRLNTFLAVDVLLLACIGVESLLHHGGIIGVAGGIGIAAMLSLSIGNAAYHLAVPRMRSYIRPIAEYVAEHRRPGDQIFALDDKEFACYWPANDPTVHTNLRRADQMPEHFWIVWSFDNVKGLRKADPIVNWARAFATEDDQIIGTGGSAYRFDTASRPKPPPIEPPALNGPSERKLYAQPRAVFGE